MLLLGRVDMLLATRITAIPLLTPRCSSVPNDAFSNRLFVIRMPRSGQGSNKHFLCTTKCCERCSIDAICLKRSLALNLLVAHQNAEIATCK